MLALLGKGAEDLCGRPSEIKLLYGDELPLLEKARTIAQRVYRAEKIAPSDRVLRKLERFGAAGFGKLPVCVAKTPLKLNLGAEFPLDDAFLYAGAGMVVVTAGAIMRMPGLPEHPAAEKIRI
ncbi:MAG: formate--tetrahydrofolate ligase, partial [Treponema sp.]|nr:formate--tetrahydrofolate ligase [Treponema sp.]